MVEHGDTRPDLAPGLASKKAIEAFKDTVHGVQVVYDFGTGKIIGIATWEPNTWSWKITRLETSAENQFRQAGIDLLTDLVAQTTGHVLSPATSLDTVVKFAMAVADPQSVVLKLCNAAVQGLAYHSGLGPIAPALGSLTEQTLARLFNRPDGQARAAKDMQVLDVMIDAATGRLTPAVHDVAAEEIADIIQHKTQGISQAELNKIEAAIRPEPKPEPKQRRPPPLDEQEQRPPPPPGPERGPPLPSEPPEISITM